METLEGRQLFNSSTLTVDSASSPVTVSATLDGAALTPNGSVTGSFSGMSEFGFTRRGFQFSDGIDGSIGIRKADVADRRFDFLTSRVFGVRLTGPIIALNSNRVGAPEKKFNAKRVAVKLVGGIASANTDSRDFEQCAGLASTGPTAYAVGRAKRTGAGLASVKVTLPIDVTFTIVTTPGMVTFRLLGTINGTSQVFATGASIAPQSVDKDDAMTPSVADDVLG